MQLAVLLRRLARPAFSNYWTPMIQPAGRKLPSLGGYQWIGRPMIGRVSQLAARRLQVALPGRLPMDWPFMAIKVKGNGKGISVKVNVKVR